MTTTTTTTTGRGTPATGGDHRLRAGAARVEITPTDADRPTRFRGVQGPISARALVIDDGHRRAAMITVDVIGIGTAVWRSVSGRLEQLHAIRADHLLLSATHTHSVPGELAEQFVEPIVAAVGEAVAALRPATLAAGTGVCHINVNRTLVDPVTGVWREGRNDEGPSDKTVAVLSFCEPDGQVIAVVHHYAVHAVVTGMLDQLGADIPGVASDHVERALGTVLGEEVLEIRRNRCDRPRERVRIAALQRTIRLPGRRRTDTGRAGRPGTYVDETLLDLTAETLPAGAGVQSPPD